MKSSVPSTQSESSASEQEGRDLLRGLTFCVFDLETTGGNHDHDKIIEIGLVRIHNLEIVDERHYMINPGMEIPEFIQKLTDIHSSDLKDAPKIEDIIDDVTQFMGDSILVAHNTSFDVPFMNSVLKRLHRPLLTNKVLCTNIMTKYLIPGIMKSNLTYLGQIFGIDHLKAHRAIEDAKATSHLLLNYLNIFIKKHIKKVNQIYYPRGRFELDRLNVDRTDSVDHIAKTCKAIPCPILITFKGDQGLLLATLPIESPETEINFIERCLHEMPWQSITIRLMVPYLEALMQLALNHSKSPLEQSGPILRYIHERLGVTTSTGMPSTLSEYHFVVTPHLVLEQYVVFPLSNIGPKNQLIFKFPYHKKKLTQYLNSHLKRSERGHPRPSGLHPDVMPAIWAHLERERSQGGHCFFIKGQEVIETSKSFFKRLEQYTKHHHLAIQFPREHI